MSCKLTTDEIEILKKSAIQAKDHSYSPYSKFRVGCAVLVQKSHDQSNPQSATNHDFCYHQVFTGCNVENASYPAGICAERAALVHAVSRGYRYGSFRGISVAVDTCATVGSEAGTSELVGRPNSHNDEGWRGKPKTWPVEKFVGPCGVCLQFLREFCDPGMPIILVDGNAKHTILPMQQVCKLHEFPGSFDP